MITTSRPKVLQDSPSSGLPGHKRHANIIEKTWNNNTDSDYTEKMVELARGFDYERDRQSFWVNPELSLLYGTPVWDQATHAQKLALNHLYWVGNYNHTAISEASTSVYNLVTSGVFEKVGGYDTLCKELVFETEQESHHIRTFQKIGYKTKLSLLGKSWLKNPYYRHFKDSDKVSSPNAVKSLLWNTFSSDPFSNALEGVANFMNRHRSHQYSSYLQDLKAKGQSLPTASDGLGGRSAPRSILKFFAANWGSSAFLAAQYYSIRYIANAILKNQEFAYFKHYKQLSKKGEYIPTPTAISYYHLLDEAFHTTISQTVAKELFADFAKPTLYERSVAGLSVYMWQRNLLSGLSGVLPGRCTADDPMFMLFFYRLFRSDLFNMSAQEAFGWLKQCFCQEHDGYHTGLKYHASLLGSLQQLFGGLEYQWAVNRDMRMMAAGASVEKSVKRNAETFSHFKHCLDGVA
ncbi:MAG: hypothetical protein ACFB16_04710 [Phormidesmis sp.]